MNSQSQTAVTRYPLLALAAAMVMPGLGQIYNGELGRGIAFFLGLAFCIPTAAWLALHAPTSLLAPIALAGFVLALATYLVALVDAVISAKRIGTNFVLQPFNRSYVYLAVILFGYFFVFGQLVDYTRQRLLATYKVPTLSMLPSIKAGDRFFADRRVNCPGCPEGVSRGDLAIFIYPNDRNTQYAKRIIGLPGDQIEINDMDVRVNGKSIRGEEVKDFGDEQLNKLLADHIAYKERGDSGDYAVIWQRNAPVARSSSSVTVPNGQVFVLGDNRDNAADSRKFGFVALTDVVAKPKQVWWSSNQEGVSWERLGALLR